MSLRERLRAMRPGQARASGAPGGSPSSPLDSGPLFTRPAAHHSLAEHFPSGHIIDTDAGPAFCIERRYPLEYRRGRFPLAAATQVPPAGWEGWLDQKTEGALTPASVAFIDLETTGLERGAGTYAFLIGIGRFVPGAFQIRQFFLRDFHEEPAVLAAVFQELEKSRGLITFNGLRFDWPLLQTRATLNRLAAPQRVHLDLLYPARRLWKPVTGDCRLSHLESAILGVRRVGDVPGYLIPQLYFRYLQTGDASPLEGILEHNRQDILTTAALAGYLGLAMSEPLEAAPLGHPLPGSDLYAIGRLLLERREWATAIRCLEEALRRNLPPALRRECRRLLALAYRRAGRAERAMEHWHALIQEDGLSVEPYVELAKYYEHRSKDLEAARFWTLKAMEVVHRRRLLRKDARAFFSGRPREHDPVMEELNHRLRRLESKLARQPVPIDFS